MACAYERPEGVTDAEWKEFLQKIDTYEEALRKRVCPDCGSALTKQLDPQQAGDSDAQGLWYNYRCTSRCGFFMDQREAN